MAQIALSLALLFSAGLFYRAAQSAARLDPGFDAHGDLVAELDYTLLGRDETNVRLVVASMADALRAHPATREVALASHLPFGGTTSGIDVTAVDESPTVKPLRSGGRMTAVSAGYFDAIGVRLLRGRDFTELEWRHPGGPHVVIIDEHMAAALFPGVDPIGRYLRRSTRPEEAPSESMEIIGVVSSHWDKVFADGPPRRVFFPLAKRFSWRVFVHVRGQSADAVASAAFTDDVRKELLAADGTAPLVQLMPYPAILNANIELWSVRFAAVLFGAFGLIALLLAVVGVYGVKAFIVARRTREFGIRIALGAGPRQVLLLLLKQGAAQIGIGLFAGLLLALATGQLLASMLLRVSPSDPLVLAGAALPLAVTVLLACWLPARRAARADPMVALRAE
jgi:predicted permease